MAQRRMISKDISTSRKVNRLTERAALLYTWSIPHTDDFGRLEGDALSLKAKVVPMRSNTTDEIEQDLKEMEGLGLIFRYEVKGEKYLEIVGFDDHQTFRADRPRRALYPSPDGTFPSDNQRDTTDIPAGDNRQRKLSKVKVSEDKVSEDTMSGGYAPEFEELWALYPRKTGKGAAYKAWQKLKASKALNAKIATSIAAYKQTRQWLKDDGQYIPHFATFINQRRFDDDPGATPGSTGGGKYGKVGRTINS